MLQNISRKIRSVLFFSSLLSLQPPDGASLQMLSLQSQSSLHHGSIVDSYTKAAFACRVYFTAQNFGTLAKSSSGIGCSSSKVLVLFHQIFRTSRPRKRRHCRWWHYRYIRSLSFSQTWGAGCCTSGARQIDQRHHVACCRPHDDLWIFEQR